MNNIIVLDLETTGCNPIKDKIIEIGAVKINDDKVIEKYSQLVNPNIEIPCFITKITNITNEMVEDKPTIEEVLPDFISFCEGYDIVGHNIKFDYSFIVVNAEKIGCKFEKNAIDTLFISRKYLGLLPSRSLGDLCNYFNINLQNAHRAINDACATYELLNILYKRYYENDNSAFKPKAINYKIKKVNPITLKQKRYLNDLINKNNINYDKDIENLTKSEASKIINELLAKISK